MNLFRQTIRLVRELGSLRRSKKPDSLVTSDAFDPKTRGANMPRSLISTLRLRSQCCGIGVPRSGTEASGVVSRCSWGAARSPEGGSSYPRSTLAAPSEVVQRSPRASESEPEGTLAEASGQVIGSSRAASRVPPGTDADAPEVVIGCPEAPINHPQGSEEGARGLRPTTPRVLLRGSASA
jgi:hypothetical protein